MIHVKSVFPNVIKMVYCKAWLAFVKCNRFDRLEFANPGQTSNLADMKIPVITGTIERRILVNYTIDLDVAKAFVPPPFTPKAFSGKAIAGICLIRLKEVRPRGLPVFLGIGSENGAHRIAVEWKENGEVKEGVYIPRRDSSSLFNTLTGGRVFPGKHHKAKFDVKEENGNYHVAFVSDGGTSISVDAKKAASL